MKTCLLSRWLVWLLVCAGSVGPAGALTVGELDGTWRVLSFGTPSQLSLTKNGANRVTDIPERQQFSFGEGRLTLASGAVSGTFADHGNAPESLTGTASITGQGQVTLTINGDEEGPTLLQVNAALDFMIATKAVGGFHELLLLLKEPAVPPGPEMVGTWAGFGFETPDQLLLQQTAGEVTNVQGADRFGLFPGSLTIHAGGTTLSGNLDGAFTGSVGAYNAGVQTLVIDPSEDEPFPIPMFINASRTIMATIQHHTDFGSQELILFLRQPTAATVDDLAGHWRTGLMQTPAALGQVKFAGFLTELNGRNSFEVLAEQITVGTGGFFTAVMIEGVATGNASVPSPATGGISVTVNEPGGGTETHALQLGATRDVMFQLLGDAFSHEVMLMVKTPPATGGKAENGLIVQATGAGVSFHWAGAPGLLLMESTDLKNWTVVPGTVGQHTHTLPGPAGSKYFQVATAPPS